jgi:hypothetical protein
MRVAIATTHHPIGGQNAGAAALLDLYDGGNLDEYLKSVQLDCFADRLPR